MTSETLLLRETLFADEAPYMLSSMATALDEETTTQLAEMCAVARHVMKCKRGEQCPVMNCWALQSEVAMKERVIQTFTSSHLGKHYAKCRKGLVGYSGRIRSRHMHSNCLCKEIRANMKGFKEEYFDESPMSRIYWLLAPSLKIR
jgi:hypothetical protein